MHKIEIVKLTKNDNPDEIVKNVLDANHFTRYKYRVKAGVVYINSNGEKYFLNGLYRIGIIIMNFYSFDSWEHQIENEQLEGSGFCKTIHFRNSRRGVQN